MLYVIMKVRIKHFSTPLEVPVLLEIIITDLVKPKVTVPLGLKVAILPQAEVNTYTVLAA